MIINSTRKVLIDIIKSSEYADNHKMKVMLEKLSAETNENATESQICDFMDLSDELDEREKVGFFCQECEEDYDFYEDMELCVICGSDEIKLI